MNLPQAPTPLVVVLGLAGLLAAYLAAWAQVRGRVPAAREFSLVMLASAVYALGYAIEISRADLPGMLDAIRVEYVGIAYIPAGLLIFVLHFTRQQPLRWYWIAALLVIPAITFGMVLTVEHHSFFYIHPQAVPGEFFPVIAFGRGPWYYVNYAYLQALTVVSIALLLVRAGRSSGRQRIQALTIAAGATFPTLGLVLYFLGFIPGKVDPTPFTLVLTGIVCSWGLFKLGLFELVPAARELALDSIRDSFLVLDRRGRLQDMNKAAWRLPGAFRLKLGETLPGDNELAVALHPLVMLRQDMVEFTARDTNNKNHTYRAQAYPILGRGARLDGTAILVSDISETVGLLNLLKTQANTDELTGLLNRRYLMTLGAQAIRNACAAHRPLGVILVDLDHFKLFNDRFGHAAGDEALRGVAETFRSGVREMDILARYGGEEFVIFLPGLDLEATIQVAERLRKQLAVRVIPFDGREYNITASFGVYAAVPWPETTLDGFLKKADWALYQAKADGRNRVRASQSKV